MLIRAGGVFSCACALACANADNAPVVVPDAAGPKDASADSAVTESADTDAEEGPAEEVGPLFDVDVPDTYKGICTTPMGTTVTASGSYMSTPESCIDGSLSTSWNSGGYTGSMRLAFPSAIAFDRLRIAANAVPVTDETYAITGFSKGSATPLGTFVRNVSGSSDWVPVIELPAGTYDELLIEIGTSASWITLAEVVVFDSKAGCSLP